MKTEDAQTVSTIADIQKDESPLPWWYWPVKLLFLICGGITVIGELIVLGAWLIALDVQKLSLYIFFAALLVSLGILVGIVELWLWLRPRSFLFSIHTSSSLLEEDANLATRSTNMAQREDLAPPHSVATNQGNGEPGNVNQSELPKVNTMRTTAPLSQAETITQSGTVTDPTSDSFSIPPQIGLPARTGTNSRSTDFSGIRFYAVAREGDNPALSADKGSVNEQNTRYALADGVGTSFLPGYWADIVTSKFIERVSDFQEREDFENWLSKCSEDWHLRVDKEWLPLARERSGQTDWSREIERGASATFVGCSFSWDELRQNGETNVHVTAVGDAVFFLVSPPLRSERREYKSFYLQSAGDFGQMTETLGSPTRRIQRDWKRVHQQDFPAQSSDTLVLATDALAQWIMRYKKAGYDPWSRLFSITNASQFAEFVDYFRSNGAMEVDDTTAIIIPLRSQSNSTKPK